MDRHDAITCIVSSARRYFRLLGQVEGMSYHRGEVEWIAPVPPAAGPKLVFHASLCPETAAARLDALLPRIRAGEMPSWWWVTPTSTPHNLCDLLAARGFARPEPNPAESEPGMALSLDDALEWPEAPAGVTVQTVRSRAEFTAWVDVVNEALHGWRMVTPEQHYPLVERGDMVCYLASLAGLPVATSATMQEDEVGSVEFVSTLEAYRRQGAGTAVSVAALRGLQESGARIATLRGSPMAVGLYRRLGFAPFFDVEIMPFQNEAGS